MAIQGLKTQIVMLSICLATSAATAAVGPGNIAPEIDSHQAFNAPSAKGISLAQYRGRVVFIDFWATWCGPCVASIPHMIDLHNKYASRGLVIIGQTDGSSRNLASFIKAKKIPYVISVGKRMAPPAYNVRGIPHGVLINGNGKVTWVGHPAGLRGNTIEAALKTVSPAAMKGYPAFETPSANRTVRSIQKSIASGKIGYGLIKLRKIMADAKNVEDVAAAEPVIKVVEAWYATKNTGAQKLEADGDIYGAWQVYALVAKTLWGTEEGTAASSKEKELKANEAYRIGMAYARLVAKLQRYPGAVQKREYAKFAKKYADSYYGSLAQKMAQ
jgi:thiol-disulfide isomerase/thioredoxin